MRIVEWANTAHGPSQVRSRLDVSRRKTKTFPGPELNRLAGFQDFSYRMRSAVANYTRRAEPPLAAETSLLIWHHFCPPIAEYIYLVKLARHQFSFENLRSLTFP